jgi:hypothetical protein
MPESALSSQQTLAVVLGASSFRRAPKLTQGRAFYNSAQDFYEYLVAPDGLNLPQDNVIWLFDESGSPSDQLEDVSEFLERRTKELKDAKTPAKDLITYYVGHGLFWGPDRAYCLAIRSTNERNEGPTSIRVSDLASIIKAHARFLRRFLIIDCCFSSSAQKEFQSGPLEVARTKLLNELPQRGTTLLCSASAQDPSIAPQGLSRTMFSDGLLTSLRTLGPWLSLSELGDLVIANLKEGYPDTWVKPEVHSPDQREGNVANVHLFPNAAFAAKIAEEERRRTEAAKAEAEKAAAEREAQRKAEEERRSARAESNQHLWAQRWRADAANFLGNFELVGANSGSLRLVGAEVSTSLAVDSSFPNKIFAALQRVQAEPDRLVLTLENVRGSSDAPDVNVYINVPEQDASAKHPDQLAGVIPLFALRHATVPDAEYSIQGLNFVLEVTHVIHALYRTGPLTAAQLRVRLVPTQSMSQKTQLIFGRIGLFRERREASEQPEAESSKIAREEVDNGPTKVDAAALRLAEQLQQYLQDVNNNEPTKSQFRKSLSTSDPTHEQHDGCGVKEGAGRVDGGLEVLRQPSVASDPCKEPLDDPAPRVNSEADLIGVLAHDLDHDQRGLGDFLASISAVGEDPLDEWEDASRG